MKVLQLLTRLAGALKQTASAHKKKLIALAILVIGFKIARRTIKTESVISIVMFFLKIWSKIMEILPTPEFANFRQVQSFQCVPEKAIPEFANVIDIRELLTKIKIKQEGALNQLKISVLSAVVLNLVLYDSTTIYDLITLKYKADFADLGAASDFQQTMAEFKADFSKNISNFRLFVVNEIVSEVDKFDLTQLVNINGVEKILRTLTDKLFSDSVDLRQRVLSRKTHAQNQKQFQVAENYFKTTKQYIQPKKPSKIAKAVKFIFSPVVMLCEGVSKIMETPQQNLSPYRFGFNEYLYILPLKKFSNTRKWPTLQSKYLLDRVVEEMINFFYSINFNIVSQKQKQFKLKMFLNRVRIYFVKKAKCSEKKLFDLLPVFYKIMQEEMNNIPHRDQFYERELITAFKDTRYKSSDAVISEYRLRNNILREIYYKKETEHIIRDMQAKLFNERDGLVIEPIPHTSRQFEEKDGIQHLMQIHNRANQEKDTTRSQLESLRMLTD